MFLFMLSGKVPKIFDYKILMFIFVLSGCAFALSYAGMAFADLNPARQIERSEKTLTSLQALADGGDPDAQFSVCEMYFNGDDVKRDYSRALMYCRKSAAQGDVNAQTYLGWMYRKGIGIARDSKQAFDWFSAAAEQGDFYAQANVGAMYAAGEGVNKDIVEAYKWAFIAEGAADQETAQGLSKDIAYLAKNMSPAEIAEAKRRAAEWVSSHPELSKVKSRTPVGLFFGIFFLPAMCIACLPGRQRRFHFYYRFFTWTGLSLITFTPLFIMLLGGLPHGVADPALVKSGLWAVGFCLLVFYVGRRSSVENFSYLDGLMFAMASLSGLWGSAKVVMAIPLLLFVIVLSAARAIINDLTGRGKHTPEAFQRLIGRIYKNRMIQ